MRSLNNNSIVTITDKQGNALYDFGGVMLPVEVLSKERVDPSAKEGYPMEWYRGMVKFGAVKVFVEDTSCGLEFGDRYFANVSIGEERVHVSFDQVSNETKEECRRTTPSLPEGMAWAYACAARRILDRI